MLTIVEDFNRQTKLLLALARVVAQNSHQVSSCVQMLLLKLDFNNHLTQKNVLKTKLRDLVNDVKRKQTWNNTLEKAQSFLKQRSSQRSAK